MSRRPAPPDQSEKNRATLKQLVKLEANKSCADCKRNKHPRWASWNLGVFICIRCSGIHRSMGVHISRVKSVDLDTWTEEQMASVLRWGNGRANKYWEAKLAPGHVPNEAKIENFIRTKYDSKRWVMDGPMPDPSTLDDEGADDDTPLNVVQEKAKVERSASVRNTGASIPAPRAPAVDLFGDTIDSTPARPSTTQPSTRAPPKVAAATARQTKPGESLLGLDFFGGTQAAPPRPSSTTGFGAPSNGRADLKNSILSLYATAPKAATPAPAAAPPADLFSSIAPSTAQKNGSGGLADLGDAFGSLSFSSAPAPKLPATTSTTLPPQQTQQPSALSGGSFFDTKPAQPAKPAPAPAAVSTSGFADFGGFESSPAPTPVATTKPAVKSSTIDLFDLSAPAPPPQKASNPPPISATSYTAAASAFNLSQPKPTPAAPAQTQTTFAANVDPWGSNDAWATPDPAPAPVTKAAPPPQTSTATVRSAAPVVASSGWGDVGGWGDAEPTPKPATSIPTTTTSSGFTVTQDEEFGGWSHASPVATSSNSKPPAGNADDLFGNVWG